MSVISLSFTAQPSVMGDEKGVEKKIPMASFPSI